MKVKPATTQNCMDRQFYALGTLNRIQIFGWAGETLPDSVQHRVEEIDNLMSAFRPESEISRLRRSAGEKPVVLSAETYRLLETAKEIGEASRGAFDITVRPLVELWGIEKKPGLVPDKTAIQNTLRYVNQNNLVLNSKNHSAFLKNAGQAADLGGIAKGYAADEAGRILRESGIGSALINLGGNIVAIGCAANTQPWKIGIQNPVAARGKHLGTLAVTDRAVVTSGSYERFFIKDGRRYHHILDPRTGKPAQSGLFSVTVVCKSSMLADALSTASFVLGIEKGVDLLKKYQAEAVFATEDYRVFVTDGLRDHFSITGQGLTVWSDDIVCRNTF